MVSLFIPDWVKLICNIEDGINITKLNKKSSLTYKTTHEYIKLLRDCEFISTTKYKDEQRIYLTESGKKIQKECFILCSSVSNFKS